MMGFGAMMLFGGLLFILFWVAVIAGAIWLVVMLARGHQGQTMLHVPASTPPSNQTALEIAKMRYARGEITKEQFEEIKRDLG